MPKKEGWLARLVKVTLASLEDWVGEDEEAGDDPRAKLHVRQQHLTGCGIAIVAMVAQVKYAEARNLMFGRDRRREFSTVYADLRAAF
jgi:hypothetical protein